MKKILKKFAFAFLLMNLALTVNLFVAQAVATPSEFVKEIGDGTNLPDYVDTGQHPDAPPNYLEPGVGTVTSPIYFALDIFRYILSAIAMISVIIAAGKLIATDEEDEYNKQKSRMVYGAAGLILVQLADIAVKRMFFGEQGEAFESAAVAEQFAEETVMQVRGLIGLAQLFIAAGAVLIIVLRGVRLLATTGDEEDLTKARQQLVWAFGGLILVGLSEVIIRGFVFPASGQELPNTEAGKRILIGLTNYASGFIAIFAFLALFYAGYRYVASGGNDEVNDTVKKTFVSALIALVLALGAFAAVNTFVTLDQGPQSTTNQNP